MFDGKYDYVTLFLFLCFGLGFFYERIESEEVVFVRLERGERGYYRVGGFGWLSG